MSKIKFTKMVIPTANYIVTTARKYKSDTTNGIVDSSLTNRYMDIQEIVSVGPLAKVSRGDIACVSFERYKVRQYKENSIASDDPSIQHMSKVERYNIPSIEINDEEYFLLGDNDVKFIIPEGGYEEIEDSVIVQPKLIV